LTDDTKLPDAAVAIVHAREPEEAVLLIRRAERETDSWSGHWSFPGGRRDPEDRDALDTALRELEEECGIRLARDQMELALPRTVARRRAPPYLSVAPFVFRVGNALDTILDPAEAAGAAWVPLRLLLDPAAHRLRPVPGRPNDMLFPAVDLAGPPLWGFTYRLITAWLGLDPAGDGAEAAARVLDFLLQQGLRLECDWNGRSAVVTGEIPTSRVLEHFTAAQNYLPGVNMLEVHRSGIQLLGPAWEEYRINAAEPLASSE
jgi:8-oxo-dGTP diphosphatase